LGKHTDLPSNAVPSTKFCHTRGEKAVISLRKNITCAKKTAKIRMENSRNQSEVGKLGLIKI
jgi:hypothetical protein